MSHSSAHPTVAFVDDEPYVLNGLRRLLRAHAEQWDMQFYQSAESFWEARRGTWPDVAVLDLNMPGWSGLDLAKAMREAGARTRCIMLTGHAGLQDAMAFINEASVFRYYMKPCAPEVLAAAVQSALAEAGAAHSPPADPAPGGRLTEAAGEALADRLAIGTLVVDPNARVVFANKAAMRLLADGSVLATDPSNRLRAASVAMTRALADAMRSVAETGTTATIGLEEPGGGTTLHATICADDAGPAGRVTLFLNDPASVRYPDAAALQQLFGLTASESRLAAGLVRGQPLDEAAEANGLKVASARTYLKSIFLKMGVTRQAELVQKALTSSAAIVLADDA